MSYDITLQQNLRQTATTILLYISGGQDFQNVA